MKKIMVLDGHSLAFRAFHAIPELVTTKGVPTNAIYGFLTMLLKIVGEYKPNKVFVAFDLHHPTFRHKMYDGYKAGRSATPESLLSQLEMIKEILGGFGITVLTKEGFEADDILGTLSRKANADGVRVHLVTGDKDSLQLVNENTTVLYTKKGVTGIVEYTEEFFREEYGISPLQFVDCKALMGDNSDNIPGVPGIGPKTAIGLLQSYDSLDGIYEHIDDIKSQATKTKLLEAKESAYMSRTLARIITDVEVEIGEIDDSAFAIMPSDETCELLRSLELMKILSAVSQPKQMMLEVENDGIFKDFVLSEVKADIAKTKVVSVFCDGVESIVKDGCVLWTSENAYIARMPIEELCRDLKDELADESIEKYLQDTKFMMHKCDEVGVVLKNAAFDYSIAAYLLDAVNWRRDIEYIALKYVGDDWKSEVKKLSTLKDELEKCLEKEEMHSLYYDMEQPLIEVLYAMEKEGVKVDLPILEALGEDYERRISLLRDEIYAIAGGEFNINSTKQLADVLFVKLGLKPVKKTKSGYSTDNEVLEQLIDDHEIIRMIIEYRQLVKLKSTYIDGLTACADGDSMIHTTFNQTVTHTGRLSSTEPNLQNIPVRSEEGVKVRTAFVAEDDEHVLVDADYSQIELRVFAHMSGDETFINAFVHGEDIHRKTASDVFGVPYDDVTDSMRSQAKAVNFGIIYGISDFGLAKNLSISKSEAKSIINDYFANYPTISAYMEQSISFARGKEYCVTEFGRKRSCKDINSRNFMLRSATERIAINMPVQGTAADIIKIAMIKVYYGLKEKGLRSRLILQVHDELIVSAHKDEIEEVKVLLKESMEGAARLSVPLVADIGVGRNWGEAK